jgi:hypothetical protein
MAKVLEVTPDYLLGFSHPEDELVDNIRYRNLLKEISELNSQDQDALFKIISGFIKGQRQSS